MRPAFVLIVLVLATRSAGADPSPVAALPAAGSGLVRAVEDGVTLDLADGRIVRLAGLEAPLPPLGRSSPSAGAPAQAALAALDAAARGREVTFRGTPEIDRWGRLVAQLETADGTWLQGMLLAAGLVRVQTAPGQRALAAEMLALEAQARRTGSGLWRSAANMVRRPTELGHASGRFELVEGVLEPARLQRGTAWLNFTEGSVAIRIDKPALLLFADAGIDPGSLVGQRVRIRGFVAWLGHPVIEITHPEQIERLSQGTP
jgi:endonuclease YncB( thermonuclease family)